MKKIAARLLVLLLSLNSYCQEIPQLDSMTLGNGLKVYLLKYGKDSTLNIKLVINGGKKNETSCQVGYSAIIKQLLKESLNEKKRAIYKNDKELSCEINNGQTIINTSCSKRNLNAEMDVLSSTLARLYFTKEKIDPIVSEIGNQYLPENMSDKNLVYLFKDLLLYGKDKPLGRNYCQYQIQKVVPEQLREFYLVHYTPSVSSLVICGNFNIRAAKKIIAKNFVRWKTLRKEDNKVEEPNEEVPEIKNKEITFVNKIDSKAFLLKWILSAPSSKSADLPAFLLTCELLNRVLKEKFSNDSLKFEPIIYTSALMEINCSANQNNLSNAIHLLDTALQNIHQTAFSTSQLSEALTELKTNFINTKDVGILSFYNPLLYDFDSRKNYLNNLSAFTIADVEPILKKYFSRDSYKLIIVGKEHLVKKELETFENVKKHQTFDFETCDETCKEIVIIKCHCESCYRRGYCNVWTFDPSQKASIKSAKSRAKFTVK